MVLEIKSHIEFRLNSVRIPIPVVECPTPRKGHLPRAFPVGAIEMCTSHAFPSLGNLHPPSELQSSTKCQLQWWNWNYTLDTAIFHLSVRHRWIFAMLIGELCTHLATKRHRVRQGSGVAWFRLIFFWLRLIFLVCSD